MFKKWLNDLNVKRLYLIFTVLALNLFNSAFANVSPPIETSIETPSKGFVAGEQWVMLSVMAADGGGVKPAKIKLTLTGTGVAKVIGTTEWVLESFKLDEVRRVSALVKTDGYGEGSLQLLAETFSATGVRLWGKVDNVYFLTTPTDIISDKGSPFSAKNKKITIDYNNGQLSELEYQKEIQNLLEGKELQFERRLKGLPAEQTPKSSRPKAIVSSATVTGRATYTHRIGRTGTTNNFATAANARAIPSALVEFYDSNAGGETKLTSSPTTVRTDSTGNYTATVPGSRSDGTAVNLVVKVKADSPAAVIGPIGVRANTALTHAFSSTAALISSSSVTVNLQVTSATSTLLGAFALHEGLLVSFNFVKSNTTANGGVQPTTIFTEFPGDSSTGSYFSKNPDYLNIGLGHAHDWDVYTHEYGHYVQKINGTTQNPGGRHFIDGNNTGMVQTFSDGTSRTLTKDQGIKLAWGEGWPTFFGTNLQISSGAGAFGIFTAGDTVYADTANSFSYDLEGNNTPWQGTGEDNELSVQRLLWDFADKPQDGHDEVQFGTDQMWVALNTGTKPVTLDQFRAKFENLSPSSAAGYSTGSQNQNRVKYGRVYFDHNIGPEPIAPAEGFSGATPPTFQWKTKGGGAAPSYHFNRFNVRFYNKNYSTVVFTSPEIPTAQGSLSADGTTASWTPSAADWATITAADPILHWAVAGSHADATTPTGPYLGLDRTLGGAGIVFVIDDTGSMSEEIAGVRAGLTSFISTLRGTPSVTSPLIEVITFKDDVTHRMASKNLDDIQGVVNALSATGGGDCPEASAEALTEAIRNVAASGVIIFATDASPHAGFDLTGIKTQALAKGVTIKQIVTGDCNASGGLSRATAGAAQTAAYDVVATGSNNPGYTGAPVNSLAVEWDSDAICIGCPIGILNGPAMTPNILKTVGDFSLPTPGAVASYTDLATASPKGSFKYMPGVNSGDSQPFINAVANAALSSVVPTVLALQPEVGNAGAVLDITVDGGSSNFRSNSVLTFSGTGVTVNSISVVSSTRLVANVTVSASAAVGFRDVLVTTNLGGGVTERAAGTGQFQVKAATTTPILTSVTPATVSQGNTAAVTVNGLNTHFVAGTTVSFGTQGITVDSVQVLSPVKLIANVTVSATANLGFRTVQVTSGSEVVSLTENFVVVQTLGLTPGVPAITSVSPNSVTQGANGVVLAVTGTNTNFVNGTTVATFSGTGITVVSTVVSSPTAAQVTVNVDSAATLGSRDINLITGGETASLVGVLSVVAPSGPTPFSFVPQTGVELNTVITSNTITVAGLTGSSPISITGGTYSVNGGAYVATPGTVSNGNTVSVRLTSSGSVNSTTSATLTIGGVSGVFSVTTRVSTPVSNARLINLSTRGMVLTGSDVMIGGFVISGTGPKQVLIRAVGPNLANYGVTGVLQDPVLQLFSGSTVIASNDDWRTSANAAAIQATGLAPVQDLESAILISLAPGAYTGIVTGYAGGTGVGIVEVYEIDTPTAPLINISTRGQVQTDSNVMIGGFVIQGTTPQTVLIRGVGPNLLNYGVTGVLANPTLQLYAGPTLIASNDDWQTPSSGTVNNVAAIQATGLAPVSPLESAILITLQPGAYTAVMSGVGGGTGVGIIEAFAR